MTSPQACTKLSVPTLIFVGLGASLIGIGVLIGWLARERTRHLPHTNGTVTSLMAFRSNKSTCHAPVIAYEVRGEFYELTPQTTHSCHLLPPSVGDTIDVYYREDDPANGRLQHFELRWLVPGLFIVVGGMLGGIGGVLSYAGDRTFSSFDQSPKT